MRHRVIHDILWVLFVPPGVTFVWLLMGRGLSRTLGTGDSEAVRGWTKSGFWFLLIFLYAAGFAFLVYKYLIHGI
jgi:hypothetical protein